MKWQFEIELEDAVDTPDAIAVVYRTKSGITTQFRQLDRSVLSKETCSRLIVMAANDVMPLSPRQRDERIN